LLLILHFYEMINQH